MKIGNNLRMIKEIVNNVATTRIIYHNTVIMTIESIDTNSRLITLNSGGWKTASTKKNINKAFALFNIPYSLYQKKHVWYIRNINSEIITDYNDCMELAA